MFDMLDEDQKTNACRKVLELLPSEWVDLETLMRDPFPPFTRSPALLSGVVARLRDDGLIELKRTRGVFKVRKAIR